MGDDQHRARFIVRFRGQGAVSVEDLERIRQLPQARVIDDGSPRMVLVESPEAPLRALVDALPGWVMAAERTLEVPDTRRHLGPPDQ